VDAVREIRELEFAGIAVRRPSAFLAPMVQQGVPIYCAGEPGAEHEGVPWAGRLEELLGKCGVILDCTTRGSGRDLAPAYMRFGNRVIYQGGEKSELAEATYCAGIGFEQLSDARSVRVESCNTTGLARILLCLNAALQLRSARAVLVRSATDPDKSGKGDLNTLISTLGESHHGRDIKRIWPNIDVKTSAITAPTNMGHLVSLFATVEAPVLVEQIVAMLDNDPRILLVKGGHGSLTELRQRAGYFPRSDCHGVLVWQEGIVADGAEVVLSFAIHMESVVIPETIDVLLVMTRLETRYGAVVRRTSRLLAGLQSPEYQSKTMVAS
jgi:glyceraldehyde-3-phosphate dehydrogenase (NAD(P))